MSSTILFLILLYLSGKLVKVGGPALGAVTFFFGCVGLILR